MSLFHHQFTQLHLVQHVHKARSYTSSAPGASILTHFMYKVNRMWKKNKNVCGDYPMHLFVYLFKRSTEKVGARVYAVADSSRKKARMGSGEKAKESKTNT